MSTSTTTFGSVGTIAGERKSTRKGFFARMIEARTRSGEAAVRFHMANMSDDRLAGLGFTAEQIAYIRTNGKIPANFWH